MTKDECSKMNCSFRWGHYESYYIETKYCGAYKERKTHPKDVGEICEYFKVCDCNFDLPYCECVPTKK